MVRIGGSVTVVDGPIVIMVKGDERVLVETSERDSVPGCMEAVRVGNRLGLGQGRMAGSPSSFCLAATPSCIGRATTRSPTTLRRIAITTTKYEYP